MTGEEIADRLIGALDRYLLAREARRAAKDRIASPRRPVSVKPLAWRCDVCGKHRPDHTIAVYSMATDMQTGKIVVGALPTDRLVITTNVKYCADKPTCKRGARDVYERWAAPLRQRVARLEKR